MDSGLRAFPLLRQLRRGPTKCAKETVASEAAMATEEEAPFPTCGPPRICKPVGEDKPFHDGGGLCSPGRWPHERRKLAEGRNWDWLRNSLFQATSDFAGGLTILEKEPFAWPRGARMAARSEIAAAEDHTEDIERLDTSPGLGRRRPAREQPLRLRLIRAILQAAYNPDSDFFFGPRRGYWASWSRYRERRVFLKNRRSGH